MTLLAWRPADRSCVNPIPAVPAGAAAAGVPGSSSRSTTAAPRDDPRSPVRPKSSLAACHCFPLCCKILTSTARSRVSMPVAGVPQQAPSVSAACLPKFSVDNPVRAAGFPWAAKANPHALRCCAASRPSSNYRRYKPCGAGHTSIWAAPGVRGYQSRHTPAANTSLRTDTIGQAFGDMTGRCPRALRAVGIRRCADAINLVVATGVWWAFQRFHCLKGSRLTPANAPISVSVAGL